MKDDVIAFVGGGNMATALISGLLASGWSPKQLRVVDPSTRCRDRLVATYGVTCSADAGEALCGARAVVWAVKPQSLQAACRQACALAPADAVHISVAAGVRMRELKLWTRSQQVVRAMPNMPALVRAGVTGLQCSEEVSEGDRLFVETILRSVGHVLWVKSDHEMDGITAASGSGPAYVFHFLEGLEDAALHMGVPEHEARHLALLVARGAVEQAIKTGARLQDLRAAVTSKGGTTEAALEVLDRLGTQQALGQAVKSARLRARHLGDELAGSQG